jgi:hypothetical protein
MAGTWAMEALRPHTIWARKVTVCAMLCVERALVEMLWAEESLKGTESRNATSL